MAGVAKGIMCRGEMLITVASIHRMTNLLDLLLKEFSQQEKVSGDGGGGGNKTGGVSVICCVIIGVGSSVVIGVANKNGAIGGVVDSGDCGSGKGGGAIGVVISSGGAVGGRSVVDGVISSGITDDSSNANNTDGSGVNGGVIGGSGGAIGGGSFADGVIDTNHASIDVITSDSLLKVSPLSSSVKAPPALQFRSLEPTMVKVLLANEGTMREENSNDKFEEEGEWILVTRKWRQRRCIDELHPLFLKKSYAPTVGKPNPVKVLKTPHVNFKKSSKSNHRTPVTLNDFFPKKFFESKVETVYTGALPLKALTSSHVEKNQSKSVVVEHIPQLNPKGKEIVADVHVRPGNTRKIQSKVTRSNDYQVMEKSLIMPITKVNSLPPSESSPVRIPCRKLQGTFSPKVYKLLENSGYDLSNPSGLGKLEPELTGEKIHGLTKAQHKLRKQGYHVDQPKTGLGYTPIEPVRIRVTQKEKCVNVQHISVEGDGKGKKPSDNRVSVFDWLGTPTARPSIFKRLGSSSRISNIHERLGASSIPQSSVFNRLGGGITQQLKKRNHDGEMDMAKSGNNNQTLILSQPQGTKSSLVLITMDGTVKVKQRIISNSLRSNENNPNEDKDF
ncbi:hypothetical protein BUALT_Bualt03G0170100 [Buddleja alternifolia]|uniref:Uncharacterized protein n=1 Tax=Buddleja alternifolia TaxID=168488 RepID=A0AAV6Y1R0_9LAMI|nr:hypothetical protein BUALT_Bualt03G0170100 [Buddleja alternifolia]